jgi:hypothetical protein
MNSTSNCTSTHFYNSPKTKEMGENMHYILWHKNIHIYMKYTAVE